MAIFLGEKRIKQIYGVSRVYLGSTLVFSNDFSNDDYLKFFIYEETEDSIIITGVYYDKWYKYFRNYDIIIPDIMKEKQVILQA